MPKYIAIVGDIPTRPSRLDVLEVLALRASSVEWAWIQAEGDAFNLPVKLLNRLLHKLRECKDPDSIAVVKLHLLNGRDTNALHRAWNDVLPAPIDITTSDELIVWLLSPDAGFVAKRPWMVTPRGAALLAVLSKLVKNKDWNKDVQGHQWTKESDLLGQSPVSRPDIPTVQPDARDIIERASETLLLTKGGSQGKTPKEWSINTKYLPMVKRAFVERSLVALSDEAGLRDLMRYVERDDREHMEIGDAIAAEVVITICREPDR